MQVGDQCHFRHTEAGGQSSKKSKKSGGKGSVASLIEAIQLGCVSQDSPQRKSILREDEKMSRMRHANSREKKGPLRGILQTCERQERIPSKLEERTHNETLRQERCARGTAWNLAKDVQQPHQGVNRYVLLSFRSLGDAGTLFDKSRGATIRGRLWSFFAYNR